MMIEIMVFMILKNVSCIPIKMLMESTHISSFDLTNLVNKINYILQIAVKFMHCFT